MACWFKLEWWRYFWYGVLFCKRRSVGMQSNPQVCDFDWLVVDDWTTNVRTLQFTQWGRNGGKTWGEIPWHPTEQQGLLIVKQCILGRVEEFPSLVYIKALINAWILTRVFLTPKSLGSEKITRVSLYPPSRKKPIFLLFTKVCS